MGFAENGWVWAVGLSFGTQSGKKLDVRKGNMGMIMAFILVASLHRSEKPLFFLWTLWTAAHGKYILERNSKWSSIQISSISIIREVRFGHPLLYSTHEFQFEDHRGRNNKKRTSSSYRILPVPFINNMKIPAGFKTK